MPPGHSRRPTGKERGTWVGGESWARGPAVGRCLQPFSCCSERHPKPNNLAQASSALLFRVSFQQPPCLWEPLHGSDRLCHEAGAP